MLHFFLLLTREIQASILQNFINTHQGNTCLYTAVLHKYSILTIARQASIQQCFMNTCQVITSLQAAFFKNTYQGNTCLDTALFYKIHQGNTSHYTVVFYKYSPWLDRALYFSVLQILARVTQASILYAKTYHSQTCLYTVVFNRYVLCYAEISKKCVFMAIQASILQ